MPGLDVLEAPIYIETDHDAVWDRYPRGSERGLVFRCVSRVRVTTARCFVRVHIDREIYEGRLPWIEKGLSVS